MNTSGEAQGRQEERPRRVDRWFDPRGIAPGQLAFVLHRITGLGLVLYLFLHLGVLSLLARGPEAWDRFVALAKTSPVLVLDVVLIFGLLFHGLNGLRLTLVSLNIGVRRQKTLFWGVALLTVIGTAVAGWMIFRMEG